MKRAQATTIALLTLVVWAPRAEAKGLVGRWTCNVAGQQAALVFRANGTLVFQGEASRYTLVPGGFRVQDEDGITSYRYRLTGNTLVVQGAEGAYRCTRGGAPARGGAAVPSPAPARGGAAPRAPSPAAPAPRGPVVGARGSAKIGRGMAGNTFWGFKFKPPAGWKFRQDNEGVLLGHDTIAGAIIVFPHYLTGIRAVNAQMQQGLHEKGTSIRPTGAISARGKNMLVTECGGTTEGQSAKGYAIGTLSPYEGGAFILALTTPAKYGAPLRKAAEAIARNMRYFKTNDAKLARIFVGRWANYSGNNQGGTLRNYTFRADGTFGDDRETSYNINTPDSNIGAYGRGGGRARWKVRGGERQGRILLIFPNGNQNHIDYRVHVQRGQTYWREYFFNGRLFRKQ
jgi:hypothetical protein